MKILRLTLEKKWFDMIASGEKNEEYREFKPYWHSRLDNKNYDAILFVNGYSKKAPRITIELKRVAYGFGNPELGAPTTEKVYILQLGKIIKGIAQ